LDICDPGRRLEFPGQAGIIRDGPPLIARSLAGVAGSFAIQTKYCANMGLSGKPVKTAGLRFSP
jgi:hypothetical protein